MECFVGSCGPLYVCTRVFTTAQQARRVGVALYVCVHLCTYMCVCVNEADIKRERLWGQAREQLHSEEEFCSADDYTCRADATPAAGALTAKVTEPGWHREGPGATGRVCVCVCRCVCVCEVMLEREVVGLRMKQLSGNGKSKGHCCLSVVYIKLDHTHQK